MKLKIIKNVFDIEIIYKMTYKLNRTSLTYSWDSFYEN